MKNYLFYFILNFGLFSVALSQPWIYDSDEKPLKMSLKEQNEDMKRQLLGIFIGGGVAYIVYRLKKDTILTVLIGGGTYLITYFFGGFAGVAAGILSVLLNARNTESLNNRSTTSVASKVNLTGTAPKLFEDHSLKIKKVYEVAKEFNISHELLIQFLIERGHSVNDHMSIVDETMLHDINLHFTIYNEAIKNTQTINLPEIQELLMSQFLETLNDQKMQKLREWRQRYDRSEYPLKVAQNLLYEALTIQKMWPELRKSFQTIGVKGERQIYTSFDEAHNYISVRRRQVQTDEIRPLVVAAYNRTETIPNLNFSTFRQRVSEAQQGNHKMFEEVEFTYFFHTAAYEMIYGWSAAGLMGYDGQKAYHSITPAIFDGLDFNSLDQLISAFGQSASMIYDPLPNVSGRHSEPDKIEITFERDKKIDTTRPEYATLLKMEDSMIKAITDLLGPLRCPHHGCNTRIVLFGNMQFRVDACCEDFKTVIRQKLC